MDVHLLFCIGRVLRAPRRSRAVRSCSVGTRVLQRYNRKRKRRSEPRTIFCRVAHAKGIYKCAYIHHHVQFVLTKTASSKSLETWKYCLCTTSDGHFSWPVVIEGVHVSWARTDVLEGTLTDIATCARQQQRHELDIWQRCSEQRAQH